MPTGESCPITCEAVGLRYCKDELNRMKFPNSPAVATANKINQRGLRNTRNGGNLFFTARMAPGQYSPSRNGKTRLSEVPSPPAPASLQLATPPANCCGERQKNANACLLLHTVFPAKRICGLTSHHAHFYRLSNVKPRNVLRGFHPLPGREKLIQLRC